MPKQLSLRRFGDRSKERHRDITIEKFAGLGINRNSLKAAAQTGLNDRQRSATVVGWSLLKALA